MGTAVAADQGWEMYTISRRRRVLRHFTPRERYRKGLGEGV